MEELNLDTFGEIIDEFIERCHVRMLIEIPAQTREVNIKDNLNMGPVLQFYVLLNALAACYAGMHNLVGFDPDKEEPLIDGILGLVKAGLMEAGRAAEEERKKDQDSQGRESDE